MKPRLRESEADISRSIQDYLHANKIFAWRNNSGAMSGTSSTGKKRFFHFGMQGSADIIGVLPGGQFLAIECKSAKGKLSQAQELFRDAVQRNGGLWILARDLRDVIAGLQ